MCVAMIENRSVIFCENLHRECSMFREEFSDRNNLYIGIIYIYNTYISENMQHSKQRAE